MADKRISDQQVNPATKSYSTQAIHPNQESLFKSGMEKVHVQATKTK
jgi:hypothetical protein